MLYDKLKELRDYVLLKNTYFNKGFAFTYQDQGVWTDEDDKTAVFPADDLGNYFYFRLPNDVGLTSIQQLAVGDCKPQASATAQVVWVACVRNANPDILMWNLITTIAGLPIYAKAFNSGILMKEKVVRQELSFLSDTGMQDALKRIPKDYSIVSVNFTITHPIPFNNCVENPCQC